MPGSRSVPEVSRWLSALSAEAFPYDLVVDDFLHAGKHFVGGDLLDLLDEARRQLPRADGTNRARAQLAAFLDIALDKRDRRYDYVTYLALPLLPLPGTRVQAAPGTAGLAVQRQHDRLFMLLIADTIRFELDVLAGRCGLLALQRPDERTTSKRLWLAVRAAQEPMSRLGLAASVPPASARARRDALAAAGETVAAAEADLGPDERRMLRLTMLPVWTAHDEYMFIRALQAFETTFALLAARLRTAVAALADRAPKAALTEINQAEAALREAGPVFSLMATMQVASFRTFREYTEGASAIQSRSYKIVEALCARPERSRLDSAAYLSVPEVREQVISGQHTLWDLLAAARRTWLPPAAHAELTAAMLSFESAVLHWRQTHYRLAVRMLGDRPGSGYTEGTPYLDRTRSIPLFPPSG